MQPLYHWLALGFCVRVTQILYFALGVTYILAFLDTNMLVISKAKLWRWGSKPTPGPNANGFASQWNIGFNRVVVIIWECM